MQPQSKPKTTYKGSYIIWGIGSLIGLLLITCLTVMGRMGISGTEFMLFALFPLVLLAYAAPLGIIMSLLYYNRTKEGSALITMATICVLLAILFALSSAN